MPVRVLVAIEAEVAGAAAGVVERAVRATLDDQGITDAEMSVTLMGDAGMAALNQEWKGGYGPTDVLAFPLYEAGEPPTGDLYVGVERAAEQSREAAEPLDRELARLAIHGTLHVLGWDHPEEDREESELWMHQERILAGLRPS